MRTAYRARSPQAVPLSDDIRKTLTNTFLSVGVMWALTAGASYMARGLQMGVGMSLVLLALSIGVIFAVHKFKNSVVGLGLLSVFSVLSGVSVGPALAHYASLPNGIEIVGGAALMTAVATFACAIYAQTARRSFSKMRGFLFAGTVMLLVASIISMFFPIPALVMTLSVIGAVLFTLWLLHDISAVVVGEETNYISAALNIYLDMLNIFLNLVRIFAGVSSND